MLTLVCRDDGKHNLFLETWETLDESLRRSELYERFHFNESSLQLSIIFFLIALKVTCTCYKFPPCFLVAVGEKIFSRKLKGKIAEGKCVSILHQADAVVQHSLHNSTQYILNKAFYT